jgi:hypothetical protein
LMGVRGRDRKYPDGLRTIVRQGCIKIVQASERA